MTKTNGRVLKLRTWPSECRLRMGGPQRCEPGSLKQTLMPARESPCSLMLTLRAMMSSEGTFSWVWVWAGAAILSVSLRGVWGEGGRRGARGEERSGRKLLLGSKPPFVLVSAVGVGMYRTGCSLDTSNVFCLDPDERTPARPPAT